MSARIILKSICESALMSPKPCKVSRQVGRLSITLHMLDYTEGEWTLDDEGEVFITSRITEIETMLNKHLQASKEGAA